MDSIIIEIYDENITENIELNEFEILIRNKKILKYNRISFKYNGKNYILSKSGNIYQIRIDIGKSLYFQKFGNIKADDLKQNKKEYDEQYQKIKKQEKIIPHDILDFFKNSKINIEY
jgi:hypothetical protein